jgi:hypothetical protein
MSEVVRALGYEVLWAPDVDYENAPPIHVDTRDFAFELSGRQLRAIAKREYASVDDARMRVEESLRGWEVVIGLEEHPGAVRFKFERAEIDEYTTDTESGTRLREAKVWIETSADLCASGHVSRGKYPGPGEAFSVDEVVEALYARYSRYQEGREPLASMAYFCLTVLEKGVGNQETEAGGQRTAAAKRYGIATDVLRHLGDIASNRGSAGEARKAPEGLAFVPLDAQERTWVVAVVRSIIRRAGEIAASPGACLEEIRMESLPSLSGGQTRGK